MLVTGLLIGIALGFVMQRGRFCVTGAFRDLWVTGNTRWLTAFLIVIAVQSVGVFTLDALGVISLSSSPFPWLSTIGGAFIFGFAIVLAGGCATGTYYRAGEGLVGSWLALIFYALFSAVSKTGALAPAVTAIRGVTVEASTVHGVLGVSPWLLVAALAVAVAALARHHLRRRPAAPMATLPARKRGIAHLLFEKQWGAFSTALVIGVLAILAWPLSWATGREAGLGITGPSSNIVNYLVAGDAEVIDWGVYLVIGILLGAFIAAKASGEFRVRIPDALTTVRSIGGGALMGIGASLAGGCTIGNAMVNTATFQLQGWVAFGFMIVGVGAATRLFITGPSKARLAAAGQGSASTASEHESMRS
ncbi:YeeE/YedE family protein [Cryobacterium adonitolivorans]|uniref:YeeE/YedE family protein n=1 Tax=Cryobacterium adonitolivorans TaxID=1259189 RepID=A0A4R8W6M3_9MICO|nr:YeeE/YedE family protein [Cryobacterium adonitolivorans]TFC01381.1 YeeE/YedE family protein [Cryobacterium adonitolivorans]